MIKQRWNKIKNKFIKKRGDYSPYVFVFSLALYVIIYSLSKDFRDFIEWLVNSELIISAFVFSIITTTIFFFLCRKLKLKSELSPAEISLIISTSALVVALLASLK